MHRLPSQYSVTRFRFAALLLLTKVLLFVGSAAVLAHALWVGDRQLTHLGVGLLCLVLPVAIAQWLVAGRARCPLCVGHPLAHSGCIPYRGTRRLFGSYRLRIALSILMKNRFRCPYCGESTLVAVRIRRDG